MSGLRIALVCDWFLPRAGGIEFHLRDLAHRLSADGNEVSVITPVRGEPVVDGIPVHRLDVPVVPRLGFAYTPAVVKAIEQTLVRERIDLAHCHVSVISPAAFGGAFRAQRAGIPTVVTFHSLIPQTPLVSKTVNLVTGAARWPVVYWAVSHYVANAVQPFAPRGQRVDVLPNGIDPLYWKGGRSTPPSDRLELVSVMRLNAKKRPFALIDLMRDLVGPGKRAVRLRVAGDGPLRSSLENAIRRSGLSAHVDLLGHIDRPALREVLSSSHLFLMPSVRESFGLAALEARCVGLPVVAMAGCGVSEFITDGVDGRLAESPRAFVACARSLVEDDDARERIARHNRETVPPGVAWTESLRHHHRAYDRAIAAVSAPAQEWVTSPGFAD